MSARYHIGVDVGGTFTDFVLLDATTGEIAREKCLTTPDDPVEGIMTGLARLRAAKGIRARDIRGLAHATTLVTNTLIERKGARTGLLTTKGFRDVMELGNDASYDMYDLAIEFPPPLVPRPRRLGIAERVGAAGEALEAPSERDIRKQARALIREGVTAIAVCFLHSYRNPAHEEAAAELIAREFPGIDISISSAVAPEIREYERTVTVAADAYVKPVVRSYMERLEATLRGDAIAAPILVMLSNGGMTTPKSAGAFPIRMIESGPAAGVLSACHAGKRIGTPSLLAFDMGGTTAKACFIDEGRPAFTGTFEAARVKRQFRGSGLPLKIASVEMIEIGAGGGSIARVDGTGLLKVGPDSAGAMPGPACYARGGTGATVTDANLVLGSLDPDHFLGGEMKLSLKEARAAMRRLGKAAKLSAVDTAAGIQRVVNQNMATAIRIHAAERGKDYRAYDLFAFGGAGPGHAYEIARILRIDRVICPLGAGTNSAWGLLVAPIAIDLSRSYNAPLHEIDWRYLADIYALMEAEARATLKDSGVKRPELIRMADMRFVGQGFELSVPIPSGRIGPGMLDAMREAFHDAYRKIYETIPGDLPIEGITWRLRAAGPEPDLRAMPRAAGKRGSAGRTRPVYFAEAGTFLDAAIHDRYALKPGDMIAGPAVVEERESTAVIGPGGRGRIDDDLNLVIDIAVPGKKAARKKESRR